MHVPSHPSETHDTLETYASRDDGHASNDASSMILLRIGYHSPVRFNHAAAESTFTVVCRRHRAAPAGCLSPAAACLPYLLPCRGMLETPPPPPELDVSCTEHERHSQRAPLRMHSPETRGAIHVRSYSKEAANEAIAGGRERGSEGARERYTHTYTPIGLTLIALHNRIIASISSTGLALIRRSRSVLRV